MRTERRADTMMHLASSDPVALVQTIALVAMVAVCAVLFRRQRLLLARLNALGLRIAQIDDRLIRAEKSLMVEIRDRYAVEGSHAARLGALASDLTELSGRVDDIDPDPYPRVARKLRTLEL
jgi:hypothetical protein